MSIFSAFHLIFSQVNNPHWGSFVHRFRVGFVSKAGQQHAFPLTAKKRSTFNTCKFLLPADLNFSGGVSCLFRMELAGDGVGGVAGFDWGIAW